MLTDAEWSDLLQGTFRLSCPEIVIESTGLIDGASTTGQGLLLQQAGTGFGFNVTGTITLPVGAILGQTGRLASLEETPPLRAIDAKGRRWVGEGVSSTATLELDGPAVVSGRVRRLRAAMQKADACPLLRLLVPGAIRLPVAVWSLEDEGILLTLTQLDGGVEITAEGSAPLPVGYDSRIEEALWFTFGELAAAVALERRIGSEVETVLCQPSFSGTVSPLGWPLLHPLPRNKAALAQIFLRYLKYAQGGPEGSYHQTSGNLRTVHSSMSSTVEEGALVLAVAIEAFVRREYPGRGAPSPDALNALDAIAELVAGWEGEASVRDRVLGCIGAIRKPNPRSALRELSKSGPLLPEHFVAWEATRHGAAHGQSTEDKLELIRRTVQLYQALVFLILGRIGYNGPIADRTSDGWPVIEFPPSQER
ncbi:MAG: hypothetical protein V4503_06465 [Gemmatimonadota bacterium]